MHFRVRLGFLEQTFGFDIKTTFSNFSFKTENLFFINAYRNLFLSYFENALKFRRT